MCGGHGAELVPGRHGEEIKCARECSPTDATPRGTHEATRMDTLVPAVLDPPSRSPRAKVPRDGVVSDAVYDAHPGVFCGLVMFVDYRANERRLACDVEVIRPALHARGDERATGLWKGPAKDSTTLVLDAIASRLAGSSVEPRIIGILPATCGYARSIFSRTEASFDALRPAIAQRTPRSPGPCSRVSALGPPRSCGAYQRERYSQARRPVKPEAPQTTSSYARGVAI